MAKATIVKASMHPQKKENVSQILKRLGMSHFIDGNKCLTCFATNAFGELK